MSQFFLDVASLRHRHLSSHYICRFNYLGPDEGPKGVCGRFGDEKGTSDPVGAILGRPRNGV